MNEEPRAWTRRLGVAIGALLLATLPGSGSTTAAAQQLSPRDPARTRILRQQIERAPVVVVDPAVLATPVERPPLPVPPVSVTTPPTTPATTLPESPPLMPAGTSTPPALPVAPPESLARGRLYYVQLDARQEAEAQGLVRERVAMIEPANAAGLKTFEGIVRQVAENDVELQLKPFVVVGRPLSWVAATRSFEGSVVVGVTEVTGSAGPARLSAPLLFEVVESAQRVTLDALSPPFGRFDVSTRATGEPVTLRIASNFSREGVSVTVPVAPTLFVEVDNDRLRGLGMQSTRVTVRAVGSTATPATVSLSAPGAFLDQDTIPLDAQGLGHTNLRGDSSGNVVLRATATGYVGAEQPVTVTWPWQTLASTCLGGLIGGFLRLAPGIRRGMRGGRFALGLAVAALTGLVVFALQVLGVKLLPVAFGFQSGDLFAFASGALGGWLGTILLPAPPATRTV